jgi:hypothetical protein
MRFVSAALNNRKLQVTERRRSAVSIIQRFLASYLWRQSFFSGTDYAHSQENK